MKYILCPIKIFYRKCYCVKMLTEQQKYRADICKITGYALATPFGRIVLDPLSLVSFNLEWLIIYVMFCLILCLIGVFLVSLGHDILAFKRNL